MDIQNFETAYLNAGGKASELEKEDGEYTSSKAQMAWEMWHAAQAVPEGFILVPKELSDDLADELASDAFNNSQSLFDYEHRDSSAAQKEQLRLRWCRNKAIDYQRNYVDMIKAQEHQA